MAKIILKNEIEDFSCDDGEIWLIFSNGEEDTINQKRFEKWLVENRSNYLQLHHGTTANNYRFIGLDIEGFYRTEKAIPALNEYLSTPQIFTQNKFSKFQNSSL